MDHGVVEKSHFLINDCWSPFFHIYFQIHQSGQSKLREISGCHGDEYEVKVGSYDFLHPCDGPPEQ
jgi:hypothetical protein